MKPLSKSPFLKCAALALFCVLALTRPAYPHAGHAKAPGEEGEEATSGPITITEEAKKNLSITVEEAEIRTLEKTFTVIGQIEPIPQLTAAVSSRIPGKITALKVAENQFVKKGDVVVEVESRQLGDPPPRVQYDAPITGIVTDRHVVLGSTVEPAEHLLEIVDLSEVYAEGRIYEGQIAWVRKDQKVRVKVESFPEETFEGTVDLVAGSLEPETRTLQIWVRIKNPDGRLRPNMRTRLNIVTGEADSVITVPHSALLGEAGHMFVFIQSDTNALMFDRRPVVLGMKDDRYFEVQEGVFPSDKVVIAGNYQLQYVTRKPEPKAGVPASEGDTNHVETATNEMAGAEAGHEHKHDGILSRLAHIPLMAWIGIGVGVLLFLNLIVLLTRKKSRAPEDSPAPSDEAPSK